MNRLRRDEPKPSAASPQRPSLEVAREAARMGSPAWPAHGHQASCAWRDGGQVGRAGAVRAPEPQVLPMRHTHLAHRGFTLLEVMVALAVLGVVLLAGTRAMDSLTHQASLHERRIAAQWCVHNALVAVRLRGQLPDVGHSEQPCEQGPLRFVVETSVWTTPNPNFRRVVAAARTGLETDALLSTIVGRY